MKPLLMIALLGATLSCKSLKTFQQDHTQTHITHHQGATQNYQQTFSQQTLWKEDTLTGTTIISLPMVLKMNGNDTLVFKTTTHQKQLTSHLKKNTTFTSHTQQYHHHQTDSTSHTQTHLLKTQKKTMAWQWLLIWIALLGVLGVFLKKVIL